MKLFGYSKTVHSEHLYLRGQVAEKHFSKARNPDEVQSRCRFLELDEAGIDHSHEWSHASGMQTVFSCRESPACSVPKSLATPADADGA